MDPHWDQLVDFGPHFHKIGKSYLGTESELWEEYDPSILLEKRGYPGSILIDQGTKDDFLDKLKH